MLQVKTKQLLGDIDELKEELYEYVDVLKGEQESPIQESVTSLFELATAYYVRAKEIEMVIYDAEMDSEKEYTKFRTGFLMKRKLNYSKRQKNLGSRLVTAHKDQLEEFLRG